MGCKKPGHPPASSGGHQRFDGFHILHGAFNTHGCRKPFFPGKPFLVHQEGLAWEEGFPTPVSIKRAMQDVETIKTLMAA